MPDFAAFTGSLSPVDLVSNPQNVANKLLISRKLTPYQVGVLLSGTTEGLVFGPYLVQELLGGGQMATVFRAIHRTSREAVAIKALRPEADRTPDARARLVREAEAVSMLKHANIAGTRQLVDSPTECYLVMEFVQGQNLEDRVRKQGPLPVPEAVDAILQAATGLEFAHQRGAVHRDIKPKNLIRCPNGQVKIMDLSLMRFDSANTWDQPSVPGERLTKAEMVLGTPFYMAPEQFADARQADARSDVYSLGCTLHFLLTGKPPYVRDTPLETVKAHLVAPIPSLPAARNDVPANLQSAFSIMVAKNINDRYQTMTEVITDLKACARKK